jgi:hypothetical protein
VHRFAGRVKVKFGPPPRAAAIDSAGWIAPDAARARGAMV